jgi:hypothetical protein
MMRVSWSSSNWSRRPIPAALFLLLLCAAPGTAEDFPSLFGSHYTAAMTLVRQRQTEWTAGLRSLGADPSLLIPVVFPELLRRSILREGLESLGLATLYVSAGSRAADFSVGGFQMKPSFAERLEDALAGMPSLPAGLRPLLGVRDAGDGRAQRAERYQRLRGEQWQLLYLAGFGLVVDAIFPPDGTGDEGRIRFLAAAYNHGFWQSRGEIGSAAGLRLFPNGGLPGVGQQYRYADVAVDFYERYWKEACAREP